MRTDGQSAVGAARPVVRGEIPYAEPATADEVRALAERVRRGMLGRSRTCIDVHARLAAAARARDLVEVEGWGILALKASAALTPRRGAAVAVRPGEAGGSVPLCVTPMVVTAVERAESEVPTIPIRFILKVVAGTYRLRVDDLISARRTKNVVLPRQIAAWLAKRMTLRSLPYIGQRMGGRDHTTVLHSVTKIEGMRARDAAFAVWLDQIEAAVLDAWAAREGGAER